MLVERGLAVDLSTLIGSAWSVMQEVRSSGPMPSEPPKGTNARLETGVQLDPDTPKLLADFIYDRLAGALREQGYSAQEVDAVLALRPERLALVQKQLAAVRAFSALPESPALAAANKRVSNILKKADDVHAHVNPELLQEQAEQDLYAALS